jgi:hypothetical protein
MRSFKIDFADWYKMDKINPWHEEGSRLDEEILWFDTQEDLENYLFAMGHVVKSGIEALKKNREKELDKAK